MMAGARDPHDIMPSWFRERFDGLTEASYTLPSTTDKAELSRCPACASVAITPKADCMARDVSHRKDGNWRCKNCANHFSERAPSANEEGVPEHDGCGRKIHVRRIETGRFRCYRCEETFEETGGEE
jgi:ribosomal protein L37AE/L43A